MTHRLAVLGATAALAGAAGCGETDEVTPTSAPPRPPASTGAPPAPPARPSDFVTSTTTRHAVVWAVGDGADGSAPAKALAARIAADRPARLLYLGDVYDDGSAGDFVDNYRPVYGRLDTRTAPTPGNHDWPQHDEGYDPYWQRVRGRRTPAYYTFGAAGWQLISLNSEIAHDAGSPQLRWLRATLARRRGTCRLAYWHRPRFSAGKHGDQDDTQPLWSALRGRTAIVLTGHDHNMQRLRPIDGITEFVSGAGGKSHYELDHGDDRLAFADDQTYGALRLELTPTAARYAFVSAAGQVLDSGSVSCRR